jgi:hypothetical protein
MVQPAYWKPKIGPLVAKTPLEEKTVSVVALSRYKTQKVDGIQVKMMATGLYEIDGKFYQVDSPKITAKAQIPDEWSLISKGNKESKKIALTLPHDFVPKAYAFTSHAPPGKLRLLVYGKYGSVSLGCAKYVDVF